MTKKEIEKGAGLLLAAVSGCEQMVELLRAAVHYCYEQEKTAKNLTPKGYAGFKRIFLLRLLKMLCASGAAYE